MNHNSNQHTLDFDIYGIIGVRLINPGPQDIAAVTRQLGPLQSTLSEEPDITIRFVENIPTPNINYLGVDFVGFTESVLCNPWTKRLR